MKKGKLIRIGTHVSIRHEGKKGTYVAHFQFKNEHASRSLRTTNLRVATKRATRLDLAIEDETYHRKSVPWAPTESVEDNSEIQIAIVKFLRSKKREISDKNFGDYKTKLGVFESYFESNGISKLSKVTTLKLDDYIEFRAAQVSEKTKHNDLTLLKQFFRWCVARKIIGENPMEHMKLRKPKNKFDRVLDLQEVDKLLNEATGEEHDVLATIAFTGARSGEIRDLRNVDVDIENRWIHIRSVPGSLTKSRVSRKVPICERLMKTLRRRIPSEKLSDYYFNAPSGTRFPEGDHHINTSRLNSEVFRDLLEKVRLPYGQSNGFTVHSLRHFFKTHMLNCGVPIHVIDHWQSHGGVGQKRASDRYVHITDAASQEWMQKISF